MLVWFLRLAFLAALLGVVACGPRSEVPVGDAAENIRKLALGYAQYAPEHGGFGPADKPALVKALVARSGLTEQEAEACFTSPRDGQPYIIRWKQRPMGADPSKPPILIYEAVGADGTRIVADGRPSVREVSAEDFAQAMPNP